MYGLHRSVQITVFQALIITTTASTLKREKIKKGLYSVASHSDNTLYMFMRQIAKSRKIGQN